MKIKKLRLVVECRVSDEKNECFDYPFLLSFLQKVVSLEKSLKITLLSLPRRDVFDPDRLEPHIEKILRAISPFPDDQKPDLKSILILSDCTKEPGLLNDYYRSIPPEVRPEKKDSITLYSLNFYFFDYVMPYIGSIEPELLKEALIHSFTDKYDTEEIKMALNTIMQWNDTKMYNAILEPPKNLKDAAKELFSSPNPNLLEKVLLNQRYKVIGRFAISNLRIASTDCMVYNCRKKSHYLPKPELDYAKIYDSLLALPVNHLIQVLNMWCSRDKTAFPSLIEALKVLTELNCLDFSVSPVPYENIHDRLPETYHFLFSKCPEFRSWFILDLLIEC